MLQFKKNTPEEISLVLASAISSNDFLAVEILLNAGAFITQKNKVGKTPIQQAAEAGNWPMVECIVNHARDTASEKMKEDKDELIFLLLLELCREYNNLDTLDQLIRAKKNGRAISAVVTTNVWTWAVNQTVGSRSSDNKYQVELNNALSLVTFGKQELLAIKLFDKGARYYAKDPALHFAFQNNFHALLAKIAPGLTRLEYTINLNDVVAVEILLKAGASITQKNKAGEPPIQQAAVDKNWRIVESIIEHGQGNSTQDEAAFGCALLVAAANKKEALAIKLFNKGARLTWSYPNDRNTPIHFAVQNHLHTLLEKLVTKPESLIQINKLEQTPLELAISLGDVLAVEILLTAGASVTQKNKAGKTPAQQGAEAKNWNMVKCIVQHGQGNDAEDSAEFGSATLTMTKALDQESKFSKLIASLCVNQANNSMVEIDRKQHRNVDLFKLTIYILQQTDNSWLGALNKELKKDPYDYLKKSNSQLGVFNTKKTSKAYAAFEAILSKKSILNLVEMKLEQARKNNSSIDYATLSSDISQLRENHEFIDTTLVFNSNPEELLKQLHEEMNKLALKYNSMATAFDVESPLFSVAASLTQLSKTF